MKENFFTEDIMEKIIDFLNFNVDTLVISPGLRIDENEEYIDNLEQKIILKDKNLNKTLKDLLKNRKSLKFTNFELIPFNIFNDNFQIEIPEKEITIRINNKNDEIEFDISINEDYIYKTEIWNFASEAFLIDYKSSYNEMRIEEMREENIFGI